MPEGSLVENILTLQGSLSAVTDLTGEPPVNGGSGSGLAGAAGLASTSLSDRVGDLEGALTLQVSDLLHFDPTTALTGVTELFGALETEVQVPPTQALEGFTQRITQADGVFMGDFVQRLQQALDAIRGISEGVPENRTAIVSALLDQILGVLASLEGPEAEKIQSWIQSLQELHRVLMPLIEAAQSAPDPSAIGVELVLRSLDSTLSYLCCSARAG